MEGVKEKQQDIQSDVKESGSSGGWNPGVTLLILIALVSVLGAILIVYKVELKTQIALFIIRNSGAGTGAGKFVRHNKLDKYLEHATYPAYFESLVRLSVHRDPSVSRSSISLIHSASAEGRIPVEKIEELVFHKDPRVRRSGIDYLSFRRGSSSVSSLIRALDDPDPYIVSSAAEMLADLKDSSAVPSLSRLILHEDKEIRSKVLYALVSINDPSAVEAMLDGLKSSNIEIRRDVSERLGHIPSSKSVVPLIKALSDPDAKVRVNAAFSLSESGDVRAVPALIKSLSDSNVEVVWGAVRSLGVFRDSRSIPHLIGILESKDPKYRKEIYRNVTVRCEAASSLGLIRDRSAVVPLTRCLLDRDLLFLECVVRALKEIGDPSALNALDSLQYRMKGPEPSDVKDPKSINGQRYKKLSKTLDETVKFLESK